MKKRKKKKEKKTIKFAETPPRSITGKGDDACVKEKKAFLFDKRSKVIFLFQAVSVEPTTPFFCLVFWAPGIRLW